MSARLTRLRSVREVELRVALGTLAAAQSDTRQAAAMTARVEQLIATVAHGSAPLQAVAATRATLIGARTRLDQRHTASATAHRTAGDAVRCCKARRDVVDTALDAARGA